MDVIAEKKEEIRIGQIKKSFVSTSTPSKQKAKMSIVWSKTDNPKTCNDCKILGDLIAYYGKDDELNTKIITEFHFYDTLIKAVVYNEKTPNDKKVKYITKCY